MINALHGILNRKQQLQTKSLADITTHKPLKGNVLEKKDEDRIRKQQEREAELQNRQQEINRRVQELRELFEQQQAEIEKEREHNQMER